MKDVTASNDQSGHESAVDQVAAGVLCHYYARGDQLKSKHVGTNMASGRRLETWALGLLPHQANSAILDAGCGWGRFAWPLIESFAVAPSKVTCVDSSLGMLETAAVEAEKRFLRPNFVSADIQALPFSARSFDGVMANHVLYHLSDILEGVRELARIVKETGWLLATTNSDEVNVPVLEFHYAALEKLGIDYVAEARSPFSMENGLKIIATCFECVERTYFEDETLYSTAEAFLASYKTIGRYRNLLAREDIENEKKVQLSTLVHQQAAEVIRKNGVLRSPVKMGAFVCRDPKL